MARKTVTGIVAPEEYTRLTRMAAAEHRTLSALLRRHIHLAAAKVRAAAPGALARDLAAFSGRYARWPAGEQRHVGVHLSSPEDFAALGVLSAVYGSKRKAVIRVLEALCGTNWPGAYVRVAESPSRGPRTPRFAPADL